MSFCFGCCAILLLWQLVKGEWAAAASIGWDSCGTPVQNSRQARSTGTRRPGFAKCMGKNTGNNPQAPNAHKTHGPCFRISFACYEHRTLTVGSIVVVEINVTLMEGKFRFSSDTNKVISSGVVIPAFALQYEVLYYTSPSLLTGEPTK